MAALPPAAIALAASAHGRLSRHQLRTELELSVHQVDNLVKSGALVVGAPGDYVVAGFPATVHRDLLGEVRRLRGHAADASALALRHAEGYPLAPPFAVAVPRLRRTRRSRGTVVAPVDLEEQDVEEVDGVPAMRVERALISLARHARRARLRTAFHDLRRRDQLDIPYLWRRADELGAVPGAPQMRALLASGELVAESPPEAELGAIWQPGDPIPTPQVWISHAGRSYRLDWVFLDSRLAPEYDGEAAHSGVGRQRDARRTLALAALGILRLPITAPMLRDPAGLRAEILAVHEQRLRAGCRPLVPEAPPAWWNGL